MSRLTQALRGLLSNFGPMVVFIVASHALSTRWAIAISMLWTVAELVWLRVRREPPPRLFLFTAVLTLGFGALDLYQQEPVFLKWEAVLSNLLTGAYFAATLRSGRSLIQEFYERSQGVAAVTKPELIRYFRAFTAVWAGYFFVKAAVYAYLAHRYNYERALAIRAVIGSVSFYALLGVSTLLGRRIFSLAQRLGFFLPREGERAVAPAVSTAP